MRKYSCAILIVAMAGPALCQDFPAEAAAVAESLQHLEEIQKEVQVEVSHEKLAEIHASLDAMKSQMAFLQIGSGSSSASSSSSGVTSAFKRATSRSDTSSYDAGTRALDQHKYDEAVAQFDLVIAAKSTRSDGALYWKAYALNRAGRKDDSLAAIADLRKDYPQSAWLNDAQALEAEVKQSNGQPVSPAQESNDDLKLMAINTLMNADPDRAIPLIEGLLKGNGPPALKSRALFVLTQSRAPRAQQVFMDYVKGSGNPDLQRQAIRYIGSSTINDTMKQQIVSAYEASADASVKSSILQALMASRSSDALLGIAKTEKDANLRAEAIRYLASNKSVPIETLASLYAGQNDAQSKRALMDLFMMRQDGKALVDMARKETDPTVKKTIVERLSSMRGNKDAMDYMVELLK